MSTEPNISVGQKSKPLPDLEHGDSVKYLVDKSWKPVTRVKKHDTPRSYHIQTHQTKETDIT